MIELKKPVQEITLKVWWYNCKAEKWEEVSNGEMLIDFAALKRENWRIILDVQVSDKKFYVATHDKDVATLLAKYKNKFPVIPASTIINFFKRERDDASIKELLPSVANVVSELEAKVVN